MEAGWDELRLPEIMARYQAGDAEAFEVLYERTVAAVTAFLASWAPPAGRADLVQETYLQIHRARRTYRPGEPVEPWLFAIARHVAWTAARTRQRRWRREIGVDTLPEPEVVPAERDVLAQRRLTEALSRLPDKQRQVIVLAHLEGWTSSEISAQTGDTVGAVKIRLHRAGRKLRQWLAAASGNERE